MSKKSLFGGPFDKEHGNLDDRLLKSEWQHLYHIYWSLWTQLSSKTSLLVICKMLGLFVNTLTGNEKYCLLNRDNLLHHFQMQFSQKKNTVSQFFTAFSKSRFNFEKFLKKDDPHSWCIFELPDSQKRA